MHRALGDRVVPREKFTVARALAVWVAGVLFASGVSVGLVATSGASSSSDATSWTLYHGAPSGAGLARDVVAVHTARAAWRSPVLDGELYGEPLITNDTVYVATENDTVYALSAANGHVRWSRHVARPVPASALPCGDISPTVGVTGTPAIDAARQELFVVADEYVGQRPRHVLVGLSTVNGRIELRHDVDPPGSLPAALLQRSGLTLDHGQVVFAMGGNWGDCSSYRGRVVAVNEVSGATRFFTVDAAANQSQGAIWMGGAAPTENAAGDLFVTSGNGSVTSAGSPYDHSDAVLELSPSLRLVQFFAPASWTSDNASDLDFSTAPALLADGRVVAAGKSRIVYDLPSRHLGGLGASVPRLGSICSGDVDGGLAVDGDLVLLPCLSGPVAIRVPATGAPRLLWSATVGGGPPIVAAGLVWTLGQDGVLYGLNESSGAVRQRASIGDPANHFPTPSVGDGLMLATSARRVVAFAAPAS